MSPASKNFKLTSNPYLLFAPFFVLYVVVVLAFPTSGLVGDEDVYLGFARNLSHGHYSPPPPHIDLAKGPGYPLVLLPFVALHIPLICVTILNALFYYFSLILLYRILMRFVDHRVAVIVAIFWACYFNVIENLVFVIAEVFTPFLVTLLLYLLLKAFDTQDRPDKKYTILSGLVFGFLILTKPVFGYVLFVLFGGSVLLWLLNRHSVQYKKSLLILAIAFGVTVPYLIYTMNLTGRKLYWSNAGGNNLYWMSTPYESEYGSWLNYPLDTITKAGIIPGAVDTIRAHHQQTLDEILRSDGAEQDDAYKKAAMANIKAHPVKFIKNCLYNVSRMIFNYPYSYKPQKPGTLIRFPFTGLILLMLIFCIAPTFKNWRKIDYALRFALLFSLIYFGGSIFGSAETRMLNPIVPILLVFIAFIATRTIRINLKFGSEQ